MLRVDKDSESGSECGSENDELEKEHNSKKDEYKKQKIIIVALMGLFAICSMGIGLLLPQILTEIAEYPLFNIKYFIFNTINSPFVLSRFLISNIF